MRLTHLPVMQFVLLVLAVLAVVSWGQFLGHLDVEELEKLHYAIEIDGKPVKINGDGNGATEAGGGGAIVPIVNKFGQRYHCRMPKGIEMEKTDGEGTDLESGDEDLAAAGGGVGNGKEKAVLTTKEKIQRMLVPLRTSGCLVRTKDWWTYELCIGRTIKQYHAEDGKPKGVIEILGNFDSDFDWGDSDSEGHSSGVGTRKYHSQFYRNGTECDLTGQFRRSEVRFVCDPSAVFDSLVEIEEPLSCEYVLTVATKKICDVDQLRPTPTERPREIKCSPALTEEEYEKYLRYEKAQEELVELRKIEQKKEQKEKMIKVLSDEDLSGIDVDSEEGFFAMEAMVQDRLATKLVAELENLLNPKTINMLGQNAEPVIFKRVFTDNLVPSHSRNPTFFDLIDGLQWEWRIKRQRQERLDRITAASNPATDDVDELDPNEEKQLRDAKAGKAVEGGKYRPKKESGDSSTFDIDAERKVRSDLVSEEEMLDDLSDAVSRMPTGRREEAKAFAQSEQFKKQLEADLEEIVTETERETGTRLEDREVLDEFSDTIKDLMAKVDRAEEQIEKVNMEMEEVRKLAADLGEPFDDDDEEEQKEVTGQKNVPDVSGGDSIDLFRGDTQKGDDVKIKVTDLTQMTTLKDSPTEDKVAKRLESVIKQKLTKAGLDTGGRQIEVKLVTTTSLGGFDGFGGETDGKSLAALTGAGADKEISDEEQQQFQNMIYNLMIGNRAAYDDIDGQRRSERNYKFAWDDTLLEKTSEAATNVRAAIESDDATKTATSEQEAPAAAESAEDTD